MPKGVVSSLMGVSSQSAISDLSGLKKTLIKRYIIERINKTEIRPKEQSKKVKSCRKNLWNEIQLKGP